MRPPEGAEGVARSLNDPARSIREQARSRIAAPSFDPSARRNLSLTSAHFEFRRRVTLVYRRPINMANDRKSETIRIQRPRRRPEPRKPAGSKPGGTGHGRLLLGIDGGGTRTVALTTDSAGSLAGRFEFGPANLKLSTDLDLVRLFRMIAKHARHPSAIGIGLAGARTEADRHRIQAAKHAVWPGVPARISHDLETALRAGEMDSRGQTTVSTSIPHPVLVLSGTGSCCYGRRPNGDSAKMGGWGHLLGDKGSGYEIGLRAMKAVVYYLDRDGDWPPLGARILRRLQLNEPDQLIDWAARAGKRDIAALATEVFEAAAGRNGDRVACDILDGALHSLAKDAAACAAKLVRDGSEPVRFILAGGVLTGQPAFARRLASDLKRRRANSTVTVLRREPAWGAVSLAAEAMAPLADQSPAWRPTRPAAASDESDTTPKKPAALSSTEIRHPGSMNLDRMKAADAIALMLDEDARLPAAIRKESAKIARAVGYAATAFRGGGRLFYVGAGTSGRLGILDASECPPTFRTHPDLVQGIIAGGQPAIWQAVEGAEDDSDAGARAVRFRRVNSEDLVIGIAASGRTPFVWGALRAAKAAGARTALIHFNTRLVIPRADRPHLEICPDIGPEILTGSTRLKSGTATKLILNMITTLAMVKTGKVISNLMIDVNPSNIKLRDRAVRIISELTGIEPARARDVLERNRWVVKDAWMSLRKRK